MVRRPLVIVAFVFLGSVASLASAQPKNVIFCVGDGMSFAQVEAATMYYGGALSFQGFTYQGEITTYSANSAVTDSAASIHQAIGASMERVGNQHPFAAPYDSFEARDGWVVVATARISPPVSISTDSQPEILSRLSNQLKTATLIR